MKQDLIASDYYLSAQRVLVMNTMKWFIRARCTNQLGQLEAIELRYCDFGEIEIEQNLLEQFFASLATLSQLRILISGRFIRPLVSQLIHLKVLIVHEFRNTPVASLGLLHQLEYLRLYRLSGDEICDTIRQLSNAYALHTLIVYLFNPSNVDDLCLSHPTKPQCLLRQLQFTGPGEREAKEWKRRYTSIVRKMLLGLPQLTSVHSIQWIDKRTRLVVKVDENGEPISTDENRTLIQRLGSLLTLTIYCHSSHTVEPAGTDLRFCTSLTELEWNCLLNIDHDHSNRLNQNIWQFFPRLKRLILQTGIPPGCRNINVLELSVLHELIQLHIFCETSTSRWIWTDELFDLLSKLPQFESYTIVDINHQPTDEPFTFSSTMLRSITQSRLWTNITISMELPKHFAENPEPEVDSLECVVFSNLDRMGWIPVQPNLETEIGSHAKWTNFRVKYNSYDYRLRLNGSRFMSPTDSTSQRPKSVDPPPPQQNKQNYIWLSNLDQDHPCTTSTHIEMVESPQLEEGTAPASCSTCTIC